MITRLRCLLICSLLTSSAVFAAETNPAPVEASTSFFRDVLPILREHCQGCHQPAKANGKLVLTDYASLMQGGRSDDAIVVPGKPDESLLIAEITPDSEGKASMPKKAPPLSAPDIEVVRKWILGGAGNDTPAAAARQYDMDNPPVYQRLPVLTAIDFSPDGNLVAVSGYHEVLLHRADGSGVVARLVGASERIQSLSFSPDGKLIAVAGGSPGRFGEIQIWDVDKAKLRHSISKTHDTLYGISWSRDGSKLAFGCADNSVRSVDVKSGEEVLFNGAHNDWVLATAFSTDDSHLVSVSRDRSLKLIKVDTQQFIDNITSITPGALKGGLMAVDCHPKRDELLVGGADGAPKIYRMHRVKARRIGDDYNLISSFDAAPGRIFSARFSADGQRFAVGSSYNGSGEVRCYTSGPSAEERDSEEKAKKEAEQNQDKEESEDQKSQLVEGKLVWKVELDTAVYSVDFHPDGNRVAAAGFDGKVRLFDAKTGELVSTFVPVPLVESEKARTRLF